MVTASLGFEMAMVGTGWGMSHFDYMDRLRKNCLHLVEGWFLARKAACALSRCMTINSADYCSSLMSGCGQSHEFAYYSWNWTWVQFWSQNLDRNGDMEC